MILQITKLMPRGPLHFGQREGWREGTEPLPHSDTLFSALCHMDWLLNGSEENELGLLKKCKEQTPGLVLSSCFPFIDNTLYWPVPLNQLSLDKDVRKIRYIETEGFQHLLAGEKLEDIYKNFQTIPNWENGQTPWIIQDVPRVGINRWTNHPDENYFHVGQVSFKENCGLYFAYNLSENFNQQSFEALIRLLVDEGLGGYRSAGYGFFHAPMFDSITLQTPGQTDGQTNLSLYFPDESEKPVFKNAFYEMIERRGFIFSPYVKSLHKKSLRMFIEGSVFPNNGAKGQLVRVSPPSSLFSTHEIIRYGLSLMVPCKI